MDNFKKGKDYVGVGAGAMIFRDDGKVFISKRGKKARNEFGKWDFPGGAVEFGEKCSHAVEREVLEEFGMKIKVLKFLEVVDHIIKEEKQHWVSPSFIAEYVSGEPKIMEPEKCEEIKWVRLQEINPDELSMASKSNFETYVRKYGFKSIYHPVSHAGLG